MFPKMCLVLSWGSQVAHLEAEVQAAAAAAKLEAERAKALQQELEHQKEQHVVAAIQQVDQMVQQLSDDDAADHVSSKPSGRHGKTASRAKDKGAAAQLVPDHAAGAEGAPHLVGLGKAADRTQPMSSASRSRTALGRSAKQQAMHAIHQQQLHQMEQDKQMCSPGRSVNISTHIQTCARATTMHHECGVCVLGAMMLGCHAVM
jgi:hypothetical protein